MLMYYPLSIYFGYTAAYELHVLCFQIDHCCHLMDLHQFYTDAYSMLHAVLAVLTLLQAFDYLQEARELHGYIPMRYPPPKL